MTALFRLANIRTKFEYAKLFVAETEVIAAISNCRPKPFLIPKTFALPRGLIH
jgi:hypothetical protein